MSNVLAGIDYKNIFKYFEEISAIPRGSGNMEAISNYLVEFAKEHKIQYIQDEVRNVIMIKEATAGYEDAPAVIIQGHMDMVCEKESWSDHDFEKDGLELIIDGDYIRANGTTLGGDNGVAVAYALAILSDDTLKHPRLEVIITTDEETGMDGVIGLDATPFKAKYMLNLDSEDEGVILCSSAGGLSGTITLPLHWEEVSQDTKTLSVMVTGLQGGHSGAEIHKNRTNANVMLGRILVELKKTQDFALGDIHGGNKHNAIPREAVATIVVPSGNVQTVQYTIKEIADVIKKELTTSEPDVAVEVTECNENCKKTVTKEERDKILFQLVVAPYGVLVMSSDMDGLVESSVNMGILCMSTEAVQFHYSVRSSLNSYKHYVSDQLALLAENIGASYLMDGEYPAWEYKKESQFRSLLIDVFKKQYNREPEVTAIHAGLECGIISEKIEGIDIVSIGPDMADIHTPKERLGISSTKRVYDYVVAVLEAIH
ncbi:aminoacyl-histidine dipeptidase [Anaerosporobacter faecicola]|uniref:aminoacyl-histidine dipeptidase n=1 Tax=Anaerosporobacter faecicola TaxID=2718714 RepID=UPI00143CB463|nr:aminoacyl-histidine dipeptidase [Anaerosporobacter faecicola]